VNARLVLEPGLRFCELGALLRQDGWQAVSQAGDPIVPGEPEHATFERPGGARLVYTFNPVCALRVLDTSAAKQIPVLPVARADMVRDWLGSADERTRMRGMLAAALPGDGADHARGGAMLAIETLKTQLAPLLEALGHDRDGRLAASLAPGPVDFARAFTAQAAAAAEIAYAAAPAARVAAIEGAGELQIALAPAGMLGDDNDLSRQFPSGYRAIAHLLAPQRIWARWKYPQAGMAYDGLVWLDERWVWFAKPYRVLSA
jgi:hypothetical protein